MSEAVYGTVAYVMRYWFFGLVCAILLGLILISIREYKNKKTVMGEVHRYIGYIEILCGPEDMVGTRIGLTAENTIGSSQRADIMIADRSVQRSHALIYLSEDGSLVLSPLGGGKTKINGRRAIRAHEIKTGDIVAFGNIEAYVYIKELEEAEAQDDAETV